MSVSLIIIIITVGASYYAWQNPHFFDKYAFYPAKVWNNKEYIRFFSSSLLHVSGMHLLFNMMTFFFFGPTVEKYFDFYTNGNGGFFLAILYIVGMVVSELGTLFKYKDNRGYSSIGASGSVSAVLFAAIWFNPTSQILVMFIPMPGFAFGAIYLLYTAYAAKNDYTGQINHDAHFYGSVWGILFSILVAPASIGPFFDQLIHFQLF
jgi:membrane associated rhomboid family serine protease